MTVWINGTLLPDSEARISVFDHGLVVGDGVFETIKVIGGVPFAVTRHLARLAQSAAGLGLPEPDLEEIAAGTLALLEASGRPATGKIRLTLTAGAGPLGSQRGDSALTAIIALGSLGGPGPTCDVVMAPWPRNEYGALTGLKTTSYAENVLALQYASARDADEAIFANTAGHLCEGTGSNIFVVSGGRLLTPPLSAGCLAGVTRDLLIEWADAVEADLAAGALAAADEAFLTGTTRDVQPIRNVDSVPLAAAPGPVTANAAKIFAARSAENPDP
ncbi:MAG: aminotransferase class IV [Streptosporangiaceae bacterium]